MIKATFCINVYSEMNTWIDFCIAIGDYEDFGIAEDIVQKAYDEWWESSDAQFNPIADWIATRLTDEDIEFEIYFKNEEEE